MSLLNVAAPFYPIDSTKIMLNKIKRLINKPKILILEDDPEQRAMLVDFALSEIKGLTSADQTLDEQRKVLESIQVMKVSNIYDLEKALRKHKGVLLAVLDCNTPDMEGGEPNDQLVKTSRGIITGQHKAVDLMIKHSPESSIILISSMDRFHRTVINHYSKNHNLEFQFVRKNEPDSLKTSILSALKNYISILN